MVGGTSVGAPAFAGIVALLNQKTGSNGLGNVNPTLYSLAASTPGAFHDITAPGDNNVPCTAGHEGLSDSSSVSSTVSVAGAGYDQVTGLGSRECDQPGECLGGADPHPGFFACWILRHNFNSRPVRHVSNRGRNQAPASTAPWVSLCQPASTSAQITCTIIPLQLRSAVLAQTAMHDYLHDRAACALRRHLIAGATWPGLAGGQQQRPVCRHFFPWRALAPPSHDRAWTHAAGILRRRRGLRWRKQQWRIRADRGNAQGQLQHHGDGHQRLVVPHCQRGCDRAVGRLEAPVWVGHSLRLRSGQALSDAFDFGLESGLMLLVIRRLCIPRSKSKASDRACPERSRRECPTHTTHVTHTPHYKSTAVVLPPHTRTPTRSPGCGR